MKRLQKTFVGFSLSIFSCLMVSCDNQRQGSSVGDNPPVASRPTVAKSADGQYISWKEHLIDGQEISGVPLSGSDGITMGDLDKDGYPDLVSVHESDVEYDGVADGYIRLAFGSADPDQWELVTLAAGSEAGAAEDTDIADLTVMAGRILWPPVNWSISSISKIQVRIFGPESGSG